MAPAVDLSIFGLLLGTRHLALAGATVAQLRPARRLLQYRRPISAETLRKRLAVGAARSRMLVAMVRTGQTGHSTLHKAPAN